MVGFGLIGSLILRDPLLLVVFSIYGFTIHFMFLMSK